LGAAFTPITVHGAWQVGYMCGTYKNYRRVVIRQNLFNNKLKDLDSSPRLVCFISAIIVVMLILGIDPGTATTGWGLIKTHNSQVECQNWGLIETAKNGRTEMRLEKIYKETLSLLKLHKPDIFVMEKIFFAANAKTAIAVGQAQGVMLLAAARSKLPVVEYAPGSIKKTITGNGRAQKKDIQKSIRKALGNHIKSKAHKKTHFDNAADALAVALTHAITLSRGE